MHNLELVFFWTVAWAHGLNDVTALSGAWSYVLYTLVSVAVLWVTLRTPAVCRWSLLGAASLVSDHYAIGRVEMIALTILPLTQAKRVFRLFFIVGHAVPRIAVAASSLPPIVTWSWLVSSVPMGVLIAGLNDRTRECLFVSLAIPHMMNTVTFTGVF